LWLLISRCKYVTPNSTDGRGGTPRLDETDRNNSLTLLQPTNKRDRKKELSYKDLHVKMGEPFVQNEKSSYGNKPHTVYRLVVTYGLKMWEVFKKHNEFEDLHNDLHVKFGVAFSDFKKIEEMVSIEQKKARLERFIEGIMYFDEVINSDSFKEFIQLVNNT